jgi:sterol desaturase/sphingolipid hydroxylase (fatty acid hydroxylase superfamily)
MHHEFTAPIGMACEYSHPVEFIFSDLLPIWATPAILPLLIGSTYGGFHPITFFLWHILNLISTISHHCGYEFPWLFGSLNPKFHDNHHKYFNGNYSSSGTLDRFHGTDIKEK